MLSYIAEFPSCLRLTNILRYAHVHNFLTHFSVNGYSGCFCICNIVNNAAIDMGCYYLFRIPISILLDEYLEVRLLEHMVVLVFFFFEECPKFDKLFKVGGNALKVTQLIKNGT